MPASRATARTDAAATPALARVEAWLSRTSGEAVAWVLFLLGLFLVADALPLG